jgi:DNA repair protein RAD50
LEAIDRQVKGIHAVKQQAGLIVRLQREIQRAKQEITQLEDNLSSTGTTKTADDVQEDLDKVTSEMSVTLLYT